MSKFTFTEFKKKLKRYHRPTLLSGGLAAKHKKKPEDFDLKVLYQGTLVEFEHTNKFNVSVSIAMDHLTESKYYYAFLAVMEKQLEMIEESETESDSD